MTYKFKIPTELHKQRFDHTAHALLNKKIANGISKAEVRKLIMVGAVYLNGKRCRIASKPVWSGNELRIEYHPQNVVPREVNGHFDPKCILYHEDGILIVNKPAGLPTVATLDNARDNLVEELKKYFSRRHGRPEPTTGRMPSLSSAQGHGGPEPATGRMPSLSLAQGHGGPEPTTGRMPSLSLAQGHGGPEPTTGRMPSLSSAMYIGRDTEQPPVAARPSTSMYIGRDTEQPPVAARPNTSMYLGIHHRLDAPTSGLVLFTTKEEMNPFASRLFQESLIQKEYLAVCTGGNPTLGQKWEIKNQLERAVRKKNIYRSTKSTEEGSFAYSRFEILQVKNNYALVRCEPVTGRTHQLRVHLAEYGMPVVGDRTYGRVKAPRLMLHAHRLTFRHPHEGREVTVEAPLPPLLLQFFQ